MIHPDMESFQIFCERQRPEKAYHWESASICACGQFAKRLKVDDWVHIGVGAEGVFWITANDLASRHPRTFGALADRVHRFRTGVAP